MAVRKAADILVYGLLSLSTAFVLSEALKVLTSISLARFLGAYDYGLWSLAWSSIGFFTITEGLLGIRPAIVRFLSQYDAEGRHDLVRQTAIVGLKLMVMATFIGGILALILAPFIAENLLRLPELTMLIQILVLGTIMGSLGIVASVFQALKKFHVTALYNVSSNGLKLVFFLAFLLLGFGLKGVAIGYTLVTAIMSAIAVVVVFVRYIPRKSCESATGDEKSFMKITKTLVSYGMPLAFSSLVLILLANFRVFYLGIWSTPADIGFFSVALALANYVRVTPMSLVNRVLFPVMSEMHAKRQIRELRRLTALVLKHMLFFMSYIVIFTWVFSSEITVLIYSPRFGSSAYYLQILIFLAMTAVPSQLANVIMLGTGRSDLILKLNTVSMIAGIVLTALMTPMFGVIGLCLAMLIKAYLISCPLYVVYAKRLVGNFLSFRSYLPVIPSAISCSALFYLANVFLLNPDINQISILFILGPIFFLCLLFYYVVLCYVGGISKTEILSVKEIISSSRMKGAIMPLAYGLKILEKFAR